MTNEKDSAADRLKAARRATGLSQAEMAHKIGISQSAFASMESGRREVQERYIMLLCAVFGISERWLKTGDGLMFITDDFAQKSVSPRKKALVEAILNLTEAQCGVISDCIMSLSTQILEAEKKQD